MTERLIFAVVALATSVGVNPGEGWPARFFVVATPMLAVGLAFWFDRQFGWVRGVISAVLVIVTMTVSLVFVRIPNLPLENRQSDGVFQRIYDHIGALNPGLFLPNEFIDIALSQWLFSGALLGIGLFAWAACSRRTFPAVGEDRPGRGSLISGSCLSIEISVDQSGEMDRRAVRRGIVAATWHPLAVEPTRRRCGNNRPSRRAMASG